MRSKQLSFLKNQRSAYGGELLKTRKGRSSGRPLSTKSSMHLILRSTQARGKWSFLKKNNARRIQSLVSKFSKKYGVKVYSLANVGNHLHFHIKLSNRYTYPAFIRALTGAIAMAVTGSSRLKELKTKFWDERPYTRVVVGFKGLLKLSNYIKINTLEGYGVSRERARMLIQRSSTA
jgi:REP element-mobilizing transposase RayT